MFKGRKSELSLLRQENWRDRGRLIVVYGRRRIGKTALIEEAFKGEAFWKFEGLEGLSTKSQLKMFSKNLSQYVGKDPCFYGDWMEALQDLADHCDEYHSKSKSRLTIFFDEFQWMCEMKPKLVSLFKYYWDNHFSKNKSCNFVLCGSISSFIVAKVIQSKALYGRVDIELNVQELDFETCYGMLPDSALQNEMMSVYMTFGGVPQYIQELNPQWSLWQNLCELAFKPSGYFFQEFTRLFISHFSKSDLYEKILFACSSGPLNGVDLSKKCGVSYGGTMVNKCRELQDAGFIGKSLPIGKGMNSKDALFYLKDEYLYFYFKLIRPNMAKWSSGEMNVDHLLKSRSYEQWKGYAFERLCMKLHKHISDELKFSAVDHQVGRYYKRGHQGERGVQVDMLFVRADRVITVCEIKSGGKISGSKIEQQIEKQRIVLEDDFPKYHLEFVLIVPEINTPIEPIPSVKKVLSMVDLLRS